ncbi:putative agmatinase 2 [Ceratocystis lukuohia]|uniref:Agmatinase 2 n=1 Tax=Ceratocystis lukuohia TaxID=2019550 RepID=A0ABR4MQX8_9PEZI
MGFKHFLILATLGFGSAHKDHHHAQASDDARADISLEEKWGTDWGFAGIQTFAHLPHVKCLVEDKYPFDIGVIGVPFDTSVSYRPGTRFGPRALRSGSSRQTPFRSFNHRAGINPYSSWARIVDCGDMNVSPFDNGLALRQMTEGYAELSKRSPTAPVHTGGQAQANTWHPAKYPSVWVPIPAPGEAFPQSFFTHGSFFWMAHSEGLIANGSVHGGIRTRLAGVDDADFRDDTEQGWFRILADDIDDIGVEGVINTIMERLGTENPVYLSVDIDIIEPGLAPGTGTPEPGGWTAREFIRILRGIEGLNVVGADIVEVSPSYDDAGETTALLGAQIAFEIITSMVKKGVEAAGAATESHDEL